MNKYWCITCEAHKNSGGGPKAPALHILATSQSFQVEIEWYQKQLWNPHNEALSRKKIAKILKIGWVMEIFVCLTKIQKRVKKIKKGRLLAIFEYTPKKAIFFKFSNHAKYHESS